MKHPYRKLSMMRLRYIDPPLTRGQKRIPPPSARSSRLPFFRWFLRSYLP